MLLRNVLGSQMQMTSNSTGGWRLPRLKSKSLGRPSRLRRRSSSRSPCRAPLAPRRCCYGVSVAIDALLSSLSDCDDTAALLVPGSWPEEDDGHDDVARMHGRLRADDHDAVDDVGGADTSPWTDDRGDAEPEHTGNNLPVTSLAPNCVTGK